MWGSASTSTRPSSALPPLPGRRRAGENYEDEAMASRSKKSWNILKQEGQDKVNQRVFMFLWRRPASTRRRRRWRWCAARPLTALKISRHKKSWHRSSPRASSTKKVKAK